MFRNLIYIILIGVLSMFILNSCSKLLEIEPPRGQLTSEDVFVDSLSAVSALSNIYYILSNGLNAGINKNLALYTNEYAYPTQNNSFHQGRVPVDDGTNGNIWSYFYEIIYSCNDIIERSNQAGLLSQSLTSQLISESKFIRALSYYYLYVLYENVPLILTTNVNGNRLAFQADSVEIFKQIESDLNEAKNNLSEAYPSAGRLRANSLTSRSLLAQVYLSQKRWENAFDEANAIINSGLYKISDDINNVFFATSEETILQLWQLNGFNSDATYLIPSSPTIVPQYIITDSLLDAFEQGDLRKEKWLGENLVSNDDDESQSYWYSYKYKNRSSNNNSPEYLIVFRLSEQFLIRAEAKVHLNDIQGAVKDLNIIRSRAGLSDLPFQISKEDLLDAIYKERRVEFFGEWAKRFIDLKRTGSINDFMSNQKDSWINGVSERLPIPLKEIEFNINLNQNAGYN